MSDRRSEEGFTLVEILIALAVLIIGITGVIQLVTVSLRSSAISRHTTEASVLGEDKLEALRTTAIGALVSGADTTTDEGRSGPGSGQTSYTRTWTVSALGGGAVATSVVVSWLENGADLYSVTLRTGRSP